jgi:Protein of unknown function (DUF4054)
LTTSLASFQAQFPELNGVPAAMLQQYLTNALLEIDYSVWNTKGDQGAYYLAAHNLATSPFGQNARMQVAKDGSTTYWKVYERLRGEVSYGYRST